MHEPMPRGPDWFVEVSVIVSVMTHTDRESVHTAPRSATPEPTDQRPSVLFLCVHNAGRSQMAAGWMRHLAGGRIDVFSGGTAPADSVNPTVVESMAEVGIDISGELPQPWTDEAVRAADAVVSMGCGDACPVYPGKRYLDWPLDDPADLSLEATRVVRDAIKEHVVGLMEDLLDSRR